MYLDQVMQLNAYIDSLGEPQRFFVASAFYIGLPLLCIGLWWLDKRLEAKKNK